MNKILWSLIYRNGVILVMVVWITFIPSEIFHSDEQDVKTNHLFALNATSPSLNFSTFLGGNDADRGYNIAVANDGSYYVIGDTYSDDFPTLNAYNSTFGSENDAFISKFSANDSLLWSTYLGGNNFDWGIGITISLDNNCYVTGKTYSSNFPTLNAFDSTYNGAGDIFVTKISTNGSILWSSFLGGIFDDGGHCIAVANDGSCYISGDTYSNDFPTLNAYDSTYGGNDFSDVFITKFSTNGSLLWSTYLGGNDFDYNYGLAMDSYGNCYVSGTTSSINFPTLNAFDSNISGADAFVTKFSINGSLLWSTFLGGNGHDNGLAIAVSNNSSCYVTGETGSTNFPVLNAYDSSHNGGWDAFVTKFSTNGNLLWSTYMGGGGDDFGYRIAIATNGNYYVTGQTESTNFPTLHAYDSTFNGKSDSFITEFSFNDTLLWSTFFGSSESDFGYGIAVTNDNSCYITGNTGSYKFPILNAYDSSYNGGYADAFIVKFMEVCDVTGPIISTVTHKPSIPTMDESITINCLVTDTSGIRTITLYYKINNNFWYYKEMNTIIDNHYYTCVGPFNFNESIKYFIEAIDNSINHNLVIDNNNSHFYGFIVQASTVPPTTTPSFSSSTLGISTYSFLACIIIMPILVLLLRKRGK